MYSKFLKSRQDNALRIVEQLSQKFSFVSILGSDVKSKSYSVNTNSSGISDGMGKECGFVIKYNKGEAFYEYACDDISDVAQIVEACLNVKVAPNLKTIAVKPHNLEPLEQDFERESDIDAYNDNDLLEIATKYRDELKVKPHVLNAICSIGVYEVSKMFISTTRKLTQHYTWINGYLMAVYSENDKIVTPRVGTYGINIKDTLDDLQYEIAKLLEKGHILATAKPIIPGYYDVITDSSISGLIAHEAFGHGVEMDQFVKDRALTKYYVGKYVASPITNMKDGAGSALSVASYFFDDDGVLAHDTTIIKDGILVSGISDLTSASLLGSEPTGNGRRETFSHKAYSRMTNTFFMPGKDKLEDMIKSIQHGYMLFDTDNGMEDPKNWNIQCVCSYGIEIVDGKLTENYVAPVVMSGSVLDLLGSISMVSSELKVIGSGGCGKGYKEWVKVSDGGPALKAKVKLA